MKKVLGVVMVACVVLGILYLVQREDADNLPIEIKPKQIVINVNDRDLIVDLEDNTSALEFYNKLKDNHITIEADDYGNFEKVGELGFELPTNDTYITTKAGDLILYEGNKITLYYDTNSYRFTKLGRVTNMDGYDLKELLGDGSVKMTFSRK